MEVNLRSVASPAFGANPVGKLKHPTFRTLRPTWTKVLLISLLGLNGFQFHQGGKMRADRDEFSRRLRDKATELEAVKKDLSNSLPLNLNKGGLTRSTGQSPLIKQPYINQNQEIPLLHNPPRQSNRNELGKGSLLDPKYAQGLQYLRKLYKKGVAISQQKEKMKNDREC